MDDGGKELLESMCTFSQGVKAIARREALKEGREAGLEEGRKMEREKGLKLYRQKQVRQIRTLMRNTNWTAPQAMDACGISKTEQKKLMLIL